MLAGGTDHKAGKKRVLRREEPQALLSDADRFAMLVQTAKELDEVIEAGSMAGVEASARSKASERTVSLPLLVQSHTVESATSERASLSGPWPVAVRRSR